MSIHSSVRLRRSWLVFGLVVLTTVLSSVNVRAAERTLRWKFKAGDSLACVSEQQIINSMHAAPGDRKFTSTQFFDVRWDIKEVDGEGAATVNQTIERIRVKIEAEAGPGTNQVIMNFDSSVEKDPTGPVAESMVPMFRLLIQHPLSYKMSSIGAISDLQLPAEMLEGFKKVEGFGKIAPVFSAEGIKQMISQTSLVLPAEAIDVGKTWQTEATFDQGPLGKTKAITVFKYTGLEMHDGKEMDKIETTVKLDIPDAEKSEAKIKITEQEGKGTIYFDNAAGRISDGAAKNTVKSNGVFMGLKVEATDETTMKMKYVPAAAK